MFDTSVVRSRSVAAPQRVTLVVVSVLFHSLAAAAAIFAAIASVEFPIAAPDQFALFRPMAAIPAPPPPPPPAPPKGKAPEVVVMKPQQEQPNVITAPQQIPDRTEPVQQTGNDDSNGEPGGEPGGQPGGEPGGVIGGTPGGTGDSLEPGLPADSGVPLHPGGEIRAAKVLQRVEPVYPRAFLGARLPNVVVTVRCVIDKNGRPRDAEILRSSYPPFNAAVLDALEKWTFSPGTRRGQPVDTWFELRVQFTVR